MRFFLIVGVTFDPLLRMEWAMCIQKIDPNFW
jgi:hypothetical protein